MLNKRFTVIVIVILSIFLIAGFLINKVGNRYSGPPVLVVSEEIGDLGEISPDKPESHIFTLKNEGGELLTIERVQAPCSCTATVLTDERLSPGKATQLEVTFNPRGYQGEVTQSVYIYSNDPENPRKRIAIKANIKHLPASKIALSVNRWNLGLLSNGDISTFLVKLSNQGDLVLEIENIVLPNEVLYEHEIPEFPILIAPDEEKELNFIYNAVDQEIGVVTEYIRLVTNDPNKKNITLRIEGYIKEKEETITIYPLKDFVITGEIGAQTYEAKLLIKNNSSSKLKQISLIPSHDYIILTSEETDLVPGEEKEITISIEERDLVKLDSEKSVGEYIYFNTAIPLNIDFGNHE